MDNFKNKPTFTFYEERDDFCLSKKSYRNFDLVSGTKEAEELNQINYPINVNPHVGKNHCILKFKNQFLPSKWNQIFNFILIEFFMFYIIYTLTFYFRDYL